MQLSYSLNLSWQIVDDILYIVDERDLSTYTLEEVGKDFWLLIGRFHDFEEILKALLQDYEGVDEKILRKDVTSLLDLLIEQGFINIEIMKCEF